MIRDPQTRDLTRRAPATRFAPSPTGYLHLGHVAAAAWVFGLGRRLGLRVLLRIEDHDAGRSRPDFETAIFADLAWLGLEHDNADLRPGALSPFRQSHNGLAYAAALAHLAARHLVYACDCTRRQIAHAAETADEPRYAGRCAGRGLPWDAPGHALRLRLPSDVVRFDDLVLGPLEQTPATQCGDLMLRDRHGQWTYQFAVTVDDWRQDVELVVRGQDLVASTGRQILLGSLLGRPAPARFAHHPLIRDGEGRKLGKRFFSEAVAKRRVAGEDASIVLGEAAYLVGLIDRPAALTAGELPSLFGDVARRYLEA